MTRLTRLGTLGAAALLATACGSPASTATPAATSPAASPTPAAPGSTIDVEQPGLTPSAGQVDTEWGPIWETLPPGFPEFPGAEPAQAEQVASAAWTVPADAGGARQVGQFYTDAFSAAGLGGTLDGPLEDGSYTSWASNGYGCDILVTVAPRGDVESLVTVLYGAGCPFEWIQ